MSKYMVNLFEPIDPDKKKNSDKKKLLSKIVK